MRRKKVSQASCRRWRRLQWRRKEIILHRLSLSITSISIFLSLNLSALLQDLKTKCKYKRKEEEHLHYPTLKHRKPSLKVKTASFLVSAGLFISERSIWKTRRGHASKIDAWLHPTVAKTRQLPRIRSNTRDISP